MASDLWTSQELLTRYRAGDGQAASQMFERYMQRLTALARTRLSARLASRTDPEDVVMSAWRSFFVRARDGRYALLRSGDLWRLLVQITLHKLYRHVRRHTAEIRSVGAEQSLEAIDSWLGPAAESPAPEEALALADELQTLLAGLDSFERRVLELRLQGELVETIAVETGRSPRTVRRALAHVRKRMSAQWSEQAAPELPFNWGQAVSPRRMPRPRVRAPLEERSERAPLAYSDYQLKRLIGAGRVGKVYRAWQKSLARLVAVKHLRKTFLQHPEVVERFIAEAETVAQLQHPGIVQVHGLGRTPGGGYFIAMDLVEGPDLASVASQGAMAIQDAVGWVRQACGAIEHAHERGVVHCDLKPANLLLDLEGRVRVTDFGLARCRVDDPSAEDRIEGTVPFMAPEQVSSVWGKIGPHTDVYGLGAVLYTLLTGHPPWRGTRLADVLAQVVSAAAVSDPRVLRPEVPCLLSEICLRCLAKRPAERFDTVRQLDAALALLPSGLL